MLCELNIHIQTLTVCLKSAPPLLKYIIFMGLFLLAHPVHCTVLKFHCGRVTSVCIYAYTYSIYTVSSNYAHDRQQHRLFLNYASTDHE